MASLPTCPDCGNDGFQGYEVQDHGVRDGDYMQSLHCCVCGWSTGPERVTMERQEELLQQRYGTPRPPSIADYWMGRTGGLWWLHDTEL